MQKWEYLVVGITTDGAHSPIWFPWYVNFVEQRNWKKGPNMAIYMNQLGEEGWELVGKDGPMLIFKRPKP